MNVIQQIKLALKLKQAQKEIKMQGVKGWLQSKAAMGVLIALVPLVSEVTGIKAEVLTGALGHVITAAGAVLSLIGTFTRKTEVSLAPYVSTEVK